MRLPDQPAGHCCCRRRPIAGEIGLDLGQLLALQRQLGFEAEGFANPRPVRREALLRTGEPPAIVLLLALEIGKSMLEPGDRRRSASW